MGKEEGACVCACVMVVVGGVLKRKIYSRQLDEKVREQIHSVSSSVVTMHIEETAFQTSKSVDFKMSVSEYRHPPTTTYTTHLLPHASPW